MLLSIESQRGKQTGTFLQNLDISGDFGLDTETGLLLISVMESPWDLGRRGEIPYNWSTGGRTDTFQRG